MVKFLSRLPMRALYAFSAFLYFLRITSSGTAPDHQRADREGLSCLERG